MCRSMTSSLKEGTTRMTGTPEISLPDSLKAFVETQAQSGGYHSANDYICALIRQDQKSKLEQTLSRLLLEGLEPASRWLLMQPSGPPYGKSLRLGDAAGPQQLHALDITECCASIRKTHPVSCIGCRSVYRGSVSLCRGLEQPRTPAARRGCLHLPLPVK
jgi:putative addiction module CopG family antidote